MSGRDIVDDIQALAAKVSASATRILTATDPGALSVERAILLGAASDIRTIRVELDALDLGAVTLLATAQAKLAAWTWERNARRDLSRLADQITSALGVLTDIGRPLTRRRVISVRYGESPQHVAQRAYGDWTKWRALLAANAIDPAATLTPGQELAVPDL